MARFAFEKPEQLIDFAHRSHHETAVQAKALVQTFYGKPAGRSYFIGCSSGGYEGLMEAQRYPVRLRRHRRRRTGEQLDATDGGGFRRRPRGAQGAGQPLAAGRPSGCCIAPRWPPATSTDGVVDGVLDDPRQCTFDPGTLTCPAGQASATCLTPAQVAAARRVYGGLRDPSTGAQLYPGLAPGSEPFWPHRDPANPFPIPLAHYKWLVFADPGWDWKTFDFSDPADYQAHLEAEAKLAPIMNATNPDLRAFRASRRQAAAVSRLERSADCAGEQHRLLRERSGVLRPQADVQDFYRLFMAPGMAHCTGGTGPNTFDMQAALEHWVERGVAPDHIVATRVDQWRRRSIAAALPVSAGLPSTTARATPTTRRTSSAGNGVWQEAFIVLTEL